MLTINSAVSRLLIWISVEMVRWIRWNWEQVAGRAAAVSLSQLVTQPPEGKPVRNWRKSSLLWFWQTVTRCFSQLSTGVWGLEAGGGGGGGGGGGCFLVRRSRGGLLRPWDGFGWLVCGRRIKENLLVDAPFWEPVWGTSFVSSLRGSEM